MTSAAPTLVRAKPMADDEAFRLPAGVRLGRVVFSHRALAAIRPASHVVVGVFNDRRIR